MLIMEGGLAGTGRRRRAAGALVRGWRRLQRLRATLALWRQRSASRAAVAHLGGHALQDIGVTADRAAREAARPFWRG